jgi:hypothetical protein
MVSIGASGKVSVFIATAAQMNAVTSWGDTEIQYWDGSNGFDFSKAKRRLWITGKHNKNEEFELVLGGVDSSAHAVDKPIWYNNIVTIICGVCSTGATTGKIILRGYIESIKFTSRDECTIKGYRSIMDKGGIQAGKKSMSPDMGGYDTKMKDLLSDLYLGTFSPFKGGEGGGADV